MFANGILPLAAVSAHRLRMLKGVEQANEFLACVMQRLPRYRCSDGIRGYSAGLKAVLAAKGHEQIRFALLVFPFRASRGISDSQGARASIGKVADLRD